MDKQIQEFAAASKAAACAVMADYGGAMAKLPLIAIAGGTKVGRAVSVVTGLAQWAAKENCELDLDKDGGEDDNSVPTGCKKSDEYTLWGRYYFKDGNTAADFGNAKEVEYYRWKQEKRDGQVYEQITREWRILSSNGWVEGSDFTLLTPGKADFDRLETSNEGGQCLEEFAGQKKLPGAVQYITEEGCTINVSLKSLTQGANGNVGGVWEIGPSEASTRESGGGIIRGCNFMPTIYYDGGDGGGPPRTFPIPDAPDPNGDWLEELLNRTLAGAAGNLLAEAIKDAFKPILPASSFTFVAPCDKTEEGVPLNVRYEMPQQDYQSRVITQQAVIMEILQQHLNWKTPICFKNEGKGDYRTISFISDESSPDGDGRLRKRFRYRSQSGIGLDGIVEHWKDFTFEAGPVCVQHRGSALGSPQVWAATANEGKRVILHAAGEAGIDPNQVGEWSIGGSDNPRYGMPGTMRVNTKGGYYWITARLGENNRPLVVPT